MAADAVNATELALFLDLVDALAGTFTKAGHVSQRVEHEHLGYCSARRGCSELCTQRRDLLERAISALEQQQERGAVA